MRHRLHAARLVVVMWLCAIPAVAQVPDSPQEIFRSWCAQCHGADGKGQVANPTVKTTPLAFTSCSLSTSEVDADWEMVISRGGPVAGLSSEMPAFGEALDADQVRTLVDYLRTFCAEPGWPHGNLNFPRPIFTEKAFPELVYNVYVGRDLAVTPDGWTIGAELNGENEEATVTPQIRRGVTRTGALAVALGVRIPLINREEQHTRWVGYLLWEFLEPVRPRR